MKSALAPLLCLTLLACSDDAMDRLDLVLSPDDLASPAMDLAPPPDLAPLPDILVLLRGLPGVTAEERPTTLPGYRFFQIQLDLPADHQNPGGQRFQQRVTLLHRGYEAPMVLLLSGYGSTTWARPARTELTSLLAANQLEVEHRYFPPSRPEPPDFSLLTIEQAAADNHQLATLLRPYYAARWVSTGASKGGMTAVYHRRFYPGDVDASVPYVAPNSLGAPDPRYVPFVASAGTDAACRARLVKFQREVLSRRAEMLTQLMASGVTFDRLGINKALEHAVLELPFGFWQYQTQARCATIPADGAPAATVYKFLNDVGQVTLYGDPGVERFGPYYYQAARQLGFPAVDEEPVKDLLQHPGTDRPAEYLPAGVTARYEPGAMPAIADWLKVQGRGLMFIYGQNDPWTAGAFEPAQDKDSYRFVVPAGNHGAKIRDLAAMDRAQALEILGRWMGVKPQALQQGLQAAPAEELLDPTLLWRSRL